MEQIPSSKQSKCWADNEEIAEQLQAVDKVYIAHRNFFLGVTENWEQELEQIRKEAEEAGIAEVISARNRQISGQ